MESKIVKTKMTFKAREKRKVKEGDIRRNPISGRYETYSPEGKWVPVYGAKSYAPKPTDNKTDKEAEWGLGSPYKATKHKKVEKKKLIRYEK